MTAGERLLPQNRIVGRVERSAKGTGHSRSRAGDVAVQLQPVNGAQLPIGGAGGAGAGAHAEAVTTFFVDVNLGGDLAVDQLEIQERAALRQRSGIVSH